MEESQHWIAVNTSNGMFPTEAAVTLETADRQTVSFFVDRALLKTNPRGEGEELRVQLVSVNREMGTERVLLPVETFETASRWVDLRIVNRGDHEWS